MSTTIDQKVVEMRFDNRNFENNVKTTMSSLEKLKERLKLTGASKGLEDVTKAANKVDFSKMEYAATKAGFQVQDIWLKTASVLEYQVARRIVNAGKNMLNALTVAPVSDGWKEYELMMNAIQTTMSATGKTSKDVEKQLKKLDEYADQTIYSTADMMNNLPKFTNAGVDLEVATKAMIGIANATAHAGGDASKASIAFYNLGQAIGTGYLTRMDYNSINNAGIATMAWKEAMVDAAIAQGTLTKVGEDSYKAGNKTLTLQQLFIDGLQEQWATTDVMLKVFGDYGDRTTEIGEKAYESAQKIKTFSMMMDSLKATAGTGWKDTWQIVFGGLEDATEFWTGINNFISDIITGMAKWRNKLLEGALGKTFTSLTETINGALGPIKNTADGVKAVVDSMKNYSEIIDEIMGGKWGNGKERWDKLTEAGYNWAEVQNKVNEKLGSSVRHAAKLEESKKSLQKTEEESNNARVRTIEQLLSMSEAEINAIDSSGKLAEALKTLKEQSEKTGIPIEDLIEDISLLNGRTLLINSFKNIGDSIVTTFKAMAAAWREIFPPLTSDHIYNIIAGFHKLTTYLKINDEAADELKRTFKGVFAILDLVTTLTAGPLKLAFKIFKSLLGALDIDILELTAKIGDAIVEFNEWIDSIIDFDAVFEVLAPYIKSITGAIKKWIDENIHLTEWLDNISKRLSTVKEAIANWITGLREAENVGEYLRETIGKIFSSIITFVKEKMKEIGTAMFEGILEFSLMDWQSVPSDIIAGFNKGFVWGILSVIKNIRTFCTKVITTVRDMFGIHSPSRVMADIGKNVVEGFINGVTSIFSNAVEVVKRLFTKIKEIANNPDNSDFFGGIIEKAKGFGAKLVEVFGQIDFGKIAAALLGAGMLLVVKKTLDVFEMFGKPLEGLGDLLAGIGEAFSGFGKNLKAAAMLKRAKAILIISLAIVILISALKPILDMDWDQLGKAALVLLGIAGILVAVTAALAAISKIGGEFGSIKMLPLAGTLIMLAFTMKMLTQVAGSGYAETTTDLFITMISGLIAIMIAFGLFVKADKAGNMDKAGVMMFKLAGALLIMASVFKIVGGFTYATIVKGISFVAGVGLIFAAVIALSHFAGEHADKAGAMIFKMSIAMLMMVAVVKIASGFSMEDIKKGVVFIGGVALLFAQIVALSYFSGQHADGAAKLIGKMGLAILMTVIAIKLVSGMSVEDVIKGIAVVAAIEALFAGIIYISKKSGKNAAKAGAMLLMMSVALGAVLLITFLASKLDPSGMWKGIAVVSALTAMFAGLIAVTRYSKGSDKLNKSLTLLMITIALMVAAVIALSFIDPKSLATATAAIMGVMGMFAVMMVATKYTKNTKHVHSSLIHMLVITSILAVIIAMMSKLDPKSALGASGSLSMLLVSFSSSIAILNKVKINETAKKTMYNMVAIAAIMAILLAAMSFIPSQNIPSLIASSVAIGILLNAFALSIRVLNKVSRINKTVQDSLYMMIAVAAALALLLAAMSFIPSQNIPSLIASSIALGVLLNAFASSIVILGMAGNVSKSNLTAIAAMTAVAAGLAIILGLMANNIATHDIPSLLASSIALGVLLNALAFSVGILSMAGPKATAAVPAAVGMSLVVGVLAVVLGLLVKTIGSSAGSALSTALSLSTLLVTMTLVMAVLAAIGPFATSAIPGALALAAVIGIIGGVLLALGALSKIPGLQELMADGGNMLQTIGTAIGQFVGGIVGGIAQGAAAALPAIGASLSAFMVGLQPFIAGVRTVDEQVLLGATCLALAIAELTAASFINGVVSLFGISLTDLGTDLSGFMAGASGFLTAIKDIKPESVQAAKSLAEMILTLTAADMINGISSFLGGGTDFSGFGTQLVAFGKAVCEFNNVLVANGGINEDAVTSAAKAGETIAGLQKALYGAGGLKQDIFGEKDLTAFGQQLRGFGRAIVDFSNILVANGGIDEKAVTSAAKAGETIAGLQSALYGAGGLKQDIFGDKDLSVFGQQLRVFGSAIVAFNNVIVTNGGINEEAVASATNSGKAIVGLQNELYGAGGLKQEIFGDKDLSVFGTQLVAFGRALVNFSSVVTGNINEEAVASATHAGTMMTAIANAIPTDTWFDGRVSLEDFGTKIVSFGQSLVNFSNILSGYSSASVGSAIGAAERLVVLTGDIVGLDVSGITLFANVTSVAGTIKQFSDNLAETNLSSVSTAISSARSLMTLIGDMVGLDTSGVSSFKNAVASLATMNLNSFAQAFQDTSAFTSIGTNIIKSISTGIMTSQFTLYPMGMMVSNTLATSISSGLPAITASITKMITSVVAMLMGKRSEFNKIGKDYMVNLSTGIRGQSGKVNTYVKTVVSSAVSTARNYRDSFYNAGKYLVIGFANGISEHTFMAEARAKAMAEAALRAARKALDEHSPSKAFYKVGAFAGQGFVNAFSDYGQKAYAAGSEMATTAKNGLSDAISKVKDMIGNDMDAQPTIRPVLDLSDVRNGVATIGGLFNGTQSVGVLANVGAVSSLMDHRNQNGANGEVVTAINKLRKDLGNVGNTVYNVNGITYDDGSNVSGAVKDLVRAMKVEGRV